MQTSRISTNVTDLPGLCYGQAPQMWHLSLDQGALKASLEVAQVLQRKYEMRHKFDKLLPVWRHRKSLRSNETIETDCFAGACPTF